MSKKKKFFQQSRAANLVPAGLIRIQGSASVNELLAPIGAVLVPKWLDLSTAGLLLPEPVEAYRVGSWQLRLCYYQGRTWPWSLTIWNTEAKPSLDQAGAVRLRYGEGLDYALWTNGTMGMSDWFSCVLAVESEAGRLERKEQEQEQDKDKDKAE